ncbi:putative odorant receptor 65c [Drosophila serrata]|uniref:putative odorant receptor 65c n=1 Tax=Drosophila serrata TaxID=7274 RepID=UPI000A1D28DB|nr:putative odorant receptor 65c [Drosophila serrata]
MASLKRFLRFYEEGWKVVRNPQYETEHLVPYYFREQLKAMLLYTNSEELRLPNRTLWYTFVLITLSLFFTTLCYGLTESMGDIVEMGRDLSFILGFIFIFFKVVYFFWYADGLDEVIDALDALGHHWLKEGPGSEEARKTRHWHFTLVVLLLTTWSFFMAVFLILVITSPLWVVQQNLPIHAKFPLDLQNKFKHPKTNVLCYLYQILVIPYCLVWLVWMEGLSVSIYWEITCAIKVLCIELRYLSKRCHGDGQLLRREVNRLIGLHQHILNILKRTNEVFTGTLKMQVIVNFFLVSLSVFEALIARKDPKVALQFGVLMLLALGHLSLWSTFGDIMSHESLNIAQAVYEAYDPHSGCKEVARDLCFMISRAQLPMQMVASPFPAFNLINYTAILNQCYSILTLLLNTLD